MLDELVRKNFLRAWKRVCEVTAWFSGQEKED